MVGFRAFAMARAYSHGVTGYVRNLPSGEVEVVAEGDRGLLDEFLKEMRRGPRSAHVRGVRVNWERARGEFADFSVEYGGW